MVEDVEVEAQEAEEEEEEEEQEEVPPCQKKPSGKQAVVQKKPSGKVPIQKKPSGKQAVVQEVPIQKKPSNSESSVNKRPAAQITPESGTSSNPKDAEESEETRDRMKARKFNAVFEQLPESVQDAWRQASSDRSGQARARKTKIVNAFVQMNETGRYVIDLKNKLAQQILHHSEQKFKENSQT
eukprot:6946341-Alexandrium_andersonii.AAC.1